MGGFGGNFDPSQSEGMTPPDSGSGFFDSENTSQLSAVSLAFTTESTEADTDESSGSTKGLKAGTAVTISGGTFTIDSADDTLHSNGNIEITGGNLTMNAGDDGIHADSTITVAGGYVSIEKSYEGIEAAIININDGTVELHATDDGINASDGTAQGGMGTFSSGAELNISGGTLYVDSDGDGLDSNGNFTLSGGTVIVNGPTNSGNGSLDGNGEIIVTGGLLIAAGSSGMAQTPGKSSTQYSVSATFDSTLSAGTPVTLTDADGNAILTFTPAKTFSNIVISTPEITKGAEYKIYTGGTANAEADKYGLSSGGAAGGTEAGTFTADSVVSTIGTQAMAGRGGGMQHGFRNNADAAMGENMTPPEISGGGFSPAGEAENSPS